MVPERREVTEAETPPAPPLKRGGEKGDPHPKLLPVIELLLQNRLTEAEIRFRELLYSARQHAGLKHKQQIARVEEYFRQQTGNGPWPADAKPWQLLEWRGQIGRLLDVLPLGELLRDLQLPTATGTPRNLIYFLKSANGERASRWELLACAYRERQWQAEKMAAAEDARRFWEEAGDKTRNSKLETRNSDSDSESDGADAAPPCPPVNGGGAEAADGTPLGPPTGCGGRTEPEWVRRLKIVTEARRQILRQPELPLERRWELQREILQAEEQLAAHGY